MFGLFKSKREKIFESEFNEIAYQCENLLNVIDEIKNRPHLISVERVKNANVFTFQRNNELIEVRTYGTISDPFPQWKKQLFR